MVALSDLLLLDTEADILASIYHVLDDLSVPYAAWKQDGIMHQTLLVIARVLAPSVGLANSLARSAFREYSSGGWLSILGSQVYGVTRIPATYATGSVTLVNSNGIPGTFGPGDLAVKNPTSNKVYANTTGFTIGAGATETVAIRALELGTDSNSGPDTITEFVISVIGYTVTNAGAVYGSDEESDDQYRARLGESLDALSPNGPRGAYQYVARSAVDSSGVSLGITRVLVSPSSTTGHVSVYVATDTGTVSGDPDDPDTPLGAVALALIDNVVPLGIGDKFTCASAVPKTLALTYEVSAKTSSRTATQCVTAANAAISAWIAGLPIGGYVTDDPDLPTIPIDALRAAIFAANPGTFHVEISAITFAGESYLGYDELNMSGNDIVVEGTMTGSATILEDL